ncbi:LacI family DNA-binding transcriptional regulator [Paraburkholderia sp. 22B1P]|uniref:LacI family DNA-binding transcriptional regulator n=1 Tax=Paraburkholderia sp. 22B1P TaxID=3080498 RepID=UPI00308E817C|nr:LacI family DNA-binding transcriptional regulator [Paraburkholderia sp. 22B1P]
MAASKAIDKVNPATRSRKSPQGAPTVQDVAKVAKVSVGSVSRVLNGRENVAPEIQEAVRKAVLELNFVPNVVARSMRKGSSKAIGCLISDIAQHTAAQMVSAAEARLREQGYEILIANSHYDLERERAILTSLKQRRLDGFIGAISDDETPAYFNLLHTLNIPIVLWERDAQGEFNSVLTDHADGCRQAVRYLTSLGHRRIGLVAGHEKTWVGREMVRGYKTACEAADVPFDATLVLRTTSFDEDECRRLLSSSVRPSALIATLNDAGTVLGVARDLGIKIPDTLSVISIGDHQYAGISSPALTVVTQDPREVGREAADMMLRLLDGTAPEGVRRSKHPMRMIIRDSCATPLLQQKRGRSRAA